MPNNVISISESDDLGRLTNRTINNAALSTEYGYCNKKSNSDYTTPLVSKETHSYKKSEFALYQYTGISINFGKSLARGIFSGFGKLLFS